MPRALARSAYGTSRRIGDAGISVARLESLTLLNATPITFALRVPLLVRHRHAPTPASGGRQINTEQPESEYCLARLATNIPELPVRASAETAATITVEMGAHVTIIDNNLDRLRELDGIFLSKIATLASSA